MTINDFTMPEEHPYGMLEGFHLEHTFQAENLLAWMLKRCIEAGNFITVHTKHRHPMLVDVGLLDELEGDGYSLTKKAKGLLWAYYGKE